MESNTMAKPVGGRGQKASKPTTMRRIPEGIKETVEVLADLYRDDEWDGSIEGLNLISSNKEKSLIPDIKNQLAELNDLREWKRRAEKQLTELGDLRENLRELQRANIQSDRDLAKAVALKCGSDDEVKRLSQKISQLETENEKLSEQTADLNLALANREEKLQQQDTLIFEMNKVIADLRTEVWLAKEGERIAREKAAISVEKGIDLAGLRDRYLLTLPPAERKKEGQRLNKFLKFSAD